MTRLPLSAALLLTLAACGDGAAPTATRDATAAIVAVPPGALTATNVNTAVFAAPVAPPAAAAATAAPSATPAAPPQTADPAVLRAQILLDRANFSPGVIDGLSGENVRQAIAAYEAAMGLPVDGLLDEAVFNRLIANDMAPALTGYAITAADVAGPFVADMPHDLEAMSKLAKLAYSGPEELLSERFHTTPAVLVALNPGVDFRKAGTRIVAPAIRKTALAAPVTRIVVDKAERAVKAYAADGRLLAFYPASIGSSDRPAPSGDMTVRAVAPNPTYTFDPKRLTYGASKTKLTVPPGPNSPVGSVWIDLSVDTFGIHGASEPKDIGKTFSHGCIRLTNWDAEQLAAAVKPGVAVAFVG
ncbi:MAG: L,D-transpeptidase [Caulobacter sp.]|nr:L,D-transpeptidase [Caulobacter sp.]